MLVTIIKSNGIFYIHIWYLHMLIKTCAKNDNFLYRNHYYKQYNLFTYKHNSIKNSGSFCLKNTLSGFFFMNIL